MSTNSDDRWWMWLLIDRARFDQSWSNVRYILVRVCNGQKNVPEDSFQCNVRGDRKLRKANKATKKRESEALLFLANAGSRIAKTGFESRLGLSHEVRCVYREGFSLKREEVRGKDTRCKGIWFSLCWLRKKERVTQNVEFA